MTTTPHTTPRTGVIIVAGGSGQRMGSPVPKQFLLLHDGCTVLEATLRRFADTLPDSEIVVILPASETERWQTICRERGSMPPHRLCTGGATRFESVRNGLAALGPCDLIAVHDGVRPLVSGALIRTCIATAAACGTAIPAVRPVDSFRAVEGSGSRIVDRDTLRAVQTPQTFRADLLRAAYGQSCSASFTDDASVVEAAGTPVTLCEGDKYNIKLTTPEDLVLARLLCEAGLA